MKTRDFLINAGFTEKEAEKIYPSIDELSVTISNDFAIGFDEARYNLIKAMNIGVRNNNKPLRKRITEGQG